MRDRSAIPVPLGSRHLLFATLQFSRCLLGMLVISCGCRPAAPALGKVTGKLTYKGQPVPEALVVFDSSETERTITAPVNPDGTYEVVMSDGYGLPPGNYQVWVTPPPQDIPRGQRTKPPPPKQYPNIPQKFRDAKTSGLSVVVADGDNRYDISM